MSPSYLLDTNIISRLLREPGGRLVRKIMQVGENQVCISIMVACELRFGVVRKASGPLMTNLERVLQGLLVLPLEGDIDKYYAEIRLALELAGQPIGPNDLLIAAHALQHNLTVVTDNVREFSRVPGLRVENWLEP